MGPEKEIIIEGESGQTYTSIQRPLEEGGDQLVGPTEEESEEEE